MDIAVSVVVATDATQSILGLIGSVDRQSLTTDECELVVVDRGLTDGQRNALRRVAARRPNVQVVRAGEDWREAARGRFVLAVPPAAELFPEALERLHAYAIEHDLEAVLGRVAASGVGVDPLTLTDRPHLDATEAALLHQRATGSDQVRAVVLALRERFAANEDPLTVSLDGARTGVLARYPAARVPAAGTAAQPAPVELTAAQVEWQGADLVVSVEAVGGEEHAPVVLARHIGTDLSFVLPSTSEAVSSFGAEPSSASDVPSPVSGQTTGGDESILEEPSTPLRTWRVVARLSPLTAAAGSPLAEGVWELDVHRATPEGMSAPSAVSGATVGPGLLDGLLVAVRAPRSGPLQIDVGPTRLSLVGQADPADASVVESARGSVLRLRLPEVNVQTTRTVPGFIALGRMILPASIETVGGTAVLVAFVSGIMGSSPISVQFGSARHQPTGLSLEISGTGRMSVATTPPAVPDPPAKPAVPKRSAQKPAQKKAAPTKAAQQKSAPKKGRKRPATGPVARLRRMVPEPLEPAVRRIRKNPTVRKVYRRLTGLTR